MATFGCCVQGPGYHFWLTGLERVIPMSGLGGAVLKVRVPAGWRCGEVSASF